MHGPPAVAATPVQAAEVAVSMVAVRPAAVVAVDSTEAVVAPRVAEVVEHPTEVEAVRPAAVAAMQVGTTK